MKSHVRLYNHRSQHKCCRVIARAFGWEGCVPMPMGLPGCRYASAHRGHHIGLQGNRVFRVQICVACISGMSGAVEMW